MPSGELSFESADLEGHPRVDELLVRLGLGGFVPGTIAAPSGRNESWTGITGQGAGVFVKIFEKRNAHARLVRTVSFAERAAEAGVRTPEVLGYDEEDCVAVFRYLDGGRSLLERFTSSEDAEQPEAFDVRWCVEAAHLVADIHRLRADGWDASPHPLPPTQLLDAIPLETYNRLSGAELHMWALLHADGQVLRAVAELRSEDGPAGIRPWVPIHGDVRLDQFLVHDGRLYITDAEESRLGDPARDVGAFAGEWLYLAVNRIPAVLHRYREVGYTPTHDDIVAAGAAELDRLSPRTQAFFSAYLERARVDPELRHALSVRSARFAGWHMLDRMIAAAQGKSRLGPIPRAAAGIGRSLLFDPERFLRTIGLSTVDHAG